MKELSRRWSVRGQRKHFCIRWWLRANPLRYLWLWLTGQATWYTRHNPPVQVELYTRPYDQDRCYCPDGSTTYMRVEFFGVGCWGWLSREWVPRPCTCDKVAWLLSPDDHVDEIEWYGLERLQAEFPGVNPL